MELTDAMKVVVKNFPEGNELVSAEGATIMAHRESGGKMCWVVVFGSGRDCRQLLIPREVGETYLTPSE